MITSIQITFIASGVTFQPSTVGAPFSEIEAPGDLGKSGRYRGVPVPIGSASFDVPEGEKEGIRYLYQTISPLLPALRAAGATDFFVHISFGYDRQCALGFGTEELRMLADLGCDVSIDCFEGDNHEAGSA